jgi:3-oxoacyl-[acyl-carrier protein] reductase
MALLKGKIAVVTGAASGMGEGVAKAFATEGAAVGLIDRNELALARIAKELTDTKARVASAYCDVGDETQVEGAFAQLEETLGTIDILVNNAGIDQAVPFDDLSLEQWDEMIRVNLRSLFLCSRAVIPAMRKKKWGRIINFGSQLAHKGAEQKVHYAAAKGGVVSFTRALSYEVIGDGITVNAICPGPIDTPMLRATPKEWLDRKFAELPAGRAGRVDEVVPTAVMLASEGGGYYVGATLNMNGGDIMV